MGKLFDGLTKPGVVEGGKPTYVDNNADAGVLMANKMRKYAQPSEANIPLSIPAPQAPPDQGISIASAMDGGNYGGNVASEPPPPRPVTFSSPSIDPNAMPHMLGPNEATPTDRPMTTKGIVLKTVLDGLLGAAAGGSAPRGESPFAAGLGAQQSVIGARERAKNYDMERQLHQAQIDNLPMVRAKNAAEIEEMKARGDYYKAGSNRRDYFNTKKGLFRVGPTGAGEIVKGTEVDDKPTLEETAEGRQTLLGNLKAKYGKDYGLTPRQEQEYTTTGKLTSSGGDPNKMTPVELAILATTEPDPKKRAAYKASLDAYAGATRPNFGPTNQDHATEKKDEQEGEAGTVASKFLVASGNDPLAASKKIDEFVASHSNLTASGRAALKRAKDELLKQHNATKKTGKTNPLDSILGNLNLGPASAATQ